MSSDLSEMASAARRAGPLEGLTVLDLTRLLPGQYCTRLFADLGARVIKVEAPPAGDPGRYGGPFVEGVPMRHLLLDRGKESVVLNLASEGGRDALGELFAVADVVVENFLPRTLDRLHLTPRSVLEAHPAIVWGSLRGYGPGAEDRAGHDLNFQAIGGGLSPVGAGGDELPLPSALWADVLAATTLAFAVVAALRGRPAAAAARHVEIACADVVLSALSLHTTAALAGVGPPRPFDTLLGASPWYRGYRCADGGWITLGALEEHFRERVRSVTGVAADGQRLGEWFAARTVTEVLEAFAGVEACVAEVRDVAQAIATASQGLVRDVAGHGSAPPHRTIASPIRIGGVYACATTPAPALGSVAS